MVPSKPLAALFLAALALPAGAARATDPVADAVRDFLYRRSRGLGEEVHIEVRPAAARMPACERPRPFLPGDGGKRWGPVTVGVHCGQRVRYRQARVTVIGTYWVTTGPVKAGALISRDMLSPARGDLGSLPQGAVLDRGRILGQVASRPLGAGAVLQDHLLKAPPLVTRRQAVTLEARGRGFRIAREGRALEEGALGESVRVRLPDRTVLNAVVSGPGRVRVEF